MTSQGATVQDMRRLCYFHVDDALFDPQSVVTVSAKFFPIMGYAGVLITASRPNTNTASIYEADSVDVGATELDKGLEYVC